jgi:hypothetical protein
MAFPIKRRAIPYPVYFYFYLYFFSPFRECLSKLPAQGATGLSQAQILSRPTTPRNMLQLHQFILEYRKIEAITR